MACQGQRELALSSEITNILLTTSERVIRIYESCPLFVGNVKSFFKAGSWRVCVSSCCGNLSLLLHRPIAFLYFYPELVSNLPTRNKTNFKLVS